MGVGQPGGLPLVLADADLRVGPGEGLEDVGEKAVDGAAQREDILVVFI